MKSRLFVAVDVETTGLGPWATPPRDDGIIEIGIATQFDGASGTSSVGALCNPGQQFFENGRATPALSVNRITIEQITNARPIDDVALTIARLLSTYAELFDVAIVAFNANFDSSFVTRSAFRNAFVGLPWFCAQRRAESVIGTRMSLRRALDWAGIDNLRPHRAEADAVACLRLWQALDASDGVYQSVDD